MAKQIPSSRTQDRILKILGVEFDGTYSHAARILEDAELPANGMVNDLGAREIKKLSDEELRAMLPANISGNAKTTSEVAAEADRTRRNAKTVRKERIKTNDRLRANGYRWARDVYVPTAADPSPLMDDYAPGGWVLLDPDGSQTTVAAALAAIRGQS